MCTPRAAGAASALERPIREPLAVCSVTQGRPRDSPAPRLGCTTGQKHSADLAGLRDGGEVAAVHATVSPWATREHPEAPASKPALGGGIGGSRTPSPSWPAGPAPRGLSTASRQRLCLEGPGKDRWEHGTDATDGARPGSAGVRGGSEVTTLLPGGGGRHVRGGRACQHGRHAPAESRLCQGLRSGSQFSPTLTMRHRGGGGGPVISPFRGEEAAA